MDRQKAFDDVIRFHQHSCPGAALGVRVAEAAMSRLGIDQASSELVLLSETDACAVDALQVLTGCTYGKRNLIHEDNGRYVFTFWRGGAPEGVRVRARADSIAYRSDDVWELVDRIQDGTATPDDEAAFAAAQEGRIAGLLAAEQDDILIVESLQTQAPQPKQLAPVDACEKCGEPTSVETLHDHRGKMLCPACHLAAHDGHLPADHAGHGHHHRSRQGGGHSHDHDHDHAHSHPAGSAELGSHGEG
jgi:formylmethanofuran dehydrogenase subunit E